MKRWTFIPIVMSAVFFAACTSVTLTPASSAGNEGMLTAKASWSSSQASRELTVLSARTTDERHFVFTCGGARPDTAKNVLRGEYYSLCYAGASYSFPDVEKFRNDNTFSLSSVRAEQPQSKISNIKTALGAPSGMEIEEVATSIPLLEASGELFIDTRMGDVQPGKATTLSFAPSDVSLTLTLNVPVSVPQGVTVEYAAACITGLPMHRYLMDNSSSRTQYGKIYLPLTYSGGKYTASIRTLGLFSPQTSVYLTGPGMLYLYLYARHEDKYYTYRLSRNMWTALATESDFSNAVMKRIEGTDRFSPRSSRADITMGQVKISKSGDGSLAFDWEEKGEFITGDELAPPGGGVL